MKNAFTKIFATFSIIVLSGCAHNNSDYYDSDKLTEEYAIKRINQNIEQSLGEIQKSYQTLIQLKLNGKNPQQYAPNDPALYKRLTVANRAFRLEDIVHDMAKASGYSFKTFGLKPASEVVIFADYKNETIYNILKDVGSQAGEDVYVEIDASRKKQISIQYIK